MDYRIEPGSVYRIPPGFHIDHALVHGHPAVFMPPGIRLGEPLEAHSMGHACAYCEATVRSNWDKCRNCGAPRRASP